MINKIIRIDKYCMAVFLNVEKVFNKVQHRGLVKKIITNSYS